MHFSSNDVFYSQLSQPFNAQKMKRIKIIFIKFREAI